MLKNGNEVKAGHVLMNAIDGAHIGDVMEVRPYTGALLPVLGDGTQIALMYGGKEMTLPAVSVYEVR